MAATPDGLISANRPPGRDIPGRDIPRREDLEEGTEEALADLDTAGPSQEDWDAALAAATCSFIGHGCPGRFCVCETGTAQAPHPGCEKEIPCSCPCHPLP